MADILERLEAIAGSVGLYITCPAATEVAREAVAEIRRLRADRDRLARELDEANAELREWEIHDDTCP